MNNQEIRKESKVEEKVTRNSVRLILAIIISICSTTLLTLLICLIPIIENGFNNPLVVPLDYNNFFYKWSYYIWRPDDYALESFAPTTGYFILSPFVLITQFIANSTLLVKDQKNKRIIIFLNWGLYIFPLTAYIVIYRLVGYGSPLMPPYEMEPIMRTLGFYPLIYLPIQILLLADNKTFREYFALARDRNSSDVPKRHLTRRINGIITLIVYLYVTSMLYHSAFSENEFLAANNQIGVAMVLLMWFYINLALFRYKHFKRFRKNFFGVFGGITHFAILFMCIYIFNILILFEFSSGPSRFRFPETIIYSLLYLSMILFCSIPIGFFGFKRRDVIITTSIISIIPLFFGIFNLILVFGSSYFGRTEFIYFSFEFLLYLAIYFAGTFWGHFLGKRLGIKDHLTKAKVGLKNDKIRI